MPWAQSVSARLLIQAGSRYENESDSPFSLGLAHYMEHMVFEGSHRHPSRRDLERAIKSYGGKVSSYTEKEYTMYQAKLPTKHADFATAFVRDLAFNPLMKPESVIKEKRIISAEIRKSYDDPSQYRWNLLRKLVWKGHPLEHNPLGTVDSIQAITRDDLIAYHQRFYRPGNAILVIAGNITHSQALDMAIKDFGDLYTSSQIEVEVQPLIFTEPSPRVLIVNKKLEETHVLLAFSTLGNGMKSTQLAEIQILARMLRDKVQDTLVYDLASSYFTACAPWLVSDNGLLVIMAGVDPERTEEVVETMVREVKELQVNENSVTDAKNALKSDLIIDLENTDAYAHFIAEQELFNGIVRSPAQTEKWVDAVTPATVHSLRKNIVTDETVALVLLGSVSKDKTETFERKLQFI